jgi:hypothetical protein
MKKTRGQKSRVRVPLINKTALYFNRKFQKGTWSSSHKKIYFSPFASCEKKHLRLQSTKTINTKKINIVGYHLYEFQNFDTYLLLPNRLRDSPSVVNLIVRFLGYYTSNFSV